MNQAARVVNTGIDLSLYGISAPAEIVHNPSYDQLFAEESRDDLQALERGTITDSGAVAVDTGAFTGRSPKDKYIVEDALTKDTLWWSTQGQLRA